MATSKTIEIMRLGYEVGDVVWAYFHFEEKNDTKARPVIILEILEDESFVCMITGTNRSTTQKGRWVTKDSEVGKKMGLLKDSFINVSRKIVVKNYMLEKDGWLGKCPFVEELLD